MATPRYITSADLDPEAAVYLQGQLFDDDHDGVIDPGLVDQVIESQADLVDAILSVRYTVPFSTTDPPKLVKIATRALVMYQAHKRIGRMTEDVREERDFVMSLLSAAASPGSQAIVASMGEDPAPEEHSSLTATVNTETRVLSRTSLAGF